MLLRYEEANLLGPLFIVIWNSNVRASWVGCLGCFVGSSPAVAMDQDPNLQAVGNRWHSLWLPVARSHLPPSPRCQLEPDIPNCYDFLKVETKDSWHTLRSVVRQFILCLKNDIIIVDSKNPNMEIHTETDKHRAFSTWTLKVHIETSGVPRGGLGCSTPPRNSEGPPKLCQTQPDL